MIVTFSLNGEKIEVLIKPTWTLLEILREHLDLTGTKCGCDTGECGLCTVLLDGKPVLSCLVLGAVCEGKEVITIEGLNGDVFEKVNQAFVEKGAVQCGYCTPSIVMVMTHYLETRPKRNIKDVLAGHICRCTGYTKILKAYESAEKSIHT